MTFKLINEISPENFGMIIASFCCRLTSRDPVNWSYSNPLWGHCAVVTLLGQEIFGGDLCRASLEGTPYEKQGSHYWNRLPDGKVFDFSGGQFPEFLATELPFELRNRQYVLSFPLTRKRHEILRSRVGSFLRLD